MVIRFVQVLEKLFFLTICFLFSYFDKAQGQDIIFPRRSVLQDKFSIVMPKDFKLMDAAYMSLKYPANNRPSEVYTNMDATVNIAFKNTDQNLAEQNVFREGKKIEQQLSSGGKIQLTSSEQLQANGNNIHVFGFYTSAIDTRVYNVMFVFSLKGKMVIGSFNCTASLQQQWQDRAYQIIRSIKEI
jgi:hypothetical protein